MIDEKYFIVGDQDLRQLQRSLLNIAKYDLIDYLYVTKSRHDGNRTENLKSMLSYKKFQDGYVLYKALHKLKDGKGIVLGKVWSAISLFFTLFLHLLIDIYVHLFLI